MSSNPPPTLKSYQDEAAGRPSPGTEWVSKNRSFNAFVSKCLVKAPKDRAKISHLLSLKFFKQAEAGKSALVQELNKVLPDVFGPLPKYKKLPSEIFTECSIVKSRSYVPGVHFVFSDDDDDDDEQMFEDFFNQKGKEKVIENSGKKEEAGSKEAPGAGSESKSAEEKRPM